MLGLMLVLTLKWWREWGIGEWGADPSCFVSVRTLAFVASPQEMLAAGIIQIIIQNTQTNFKNQPPAGSLQCCSPLTIKILPLIFLRYSFPSPAVGRAVCALGFLISPCFPASCGWRLQSIFS